MGSVAGEQGELGPAELGSLYETYWPSLVRTAWMMTGSRAEAEDIVHDAFVRLASGRHRVPEHPLSYLRRAVANQVRDRWRHRVVELRHSRPPGDEPVLGIEERLVWHLFQKLPARQRQVLVLRYYDNLELAEISELLGYPLGTTKSLAHRGLERLRKEMEGDG
jgi:RNA polymerase sigma factor (sigma-70 family)